MLQEFQPTPASACIITPDLAGIPRHGGIGTACSELAKALAADGHDVHILFTGRNAPTHGAEILAQAKKQYCHWGITLCIAEEWPGNSATATDFPDHPHLRMSRIAHEWLKERQFGLVLFMDWQGPGFYALSARRANLAHRQHGAMVVVCHRPTLWSHLGQSVERPTPMDALTYFIERRSTEMADAAISPSRYLLDWMRGRGYRLPQRTLVRPNLPGYTPATAPGQQPNEVVFLGRLECRKGLPQFCTAIDHLISQGQPPSRVIFLGKMGFIADEHAAVYLARRTHDWPMPAEVISHTSRSEALHLLATRRCVAVVPSTQEISPYSVYKCLMAGIPVIARDVGGIAELYAADHHGTHLFGDNPADLADRIADALGGRIGPARLSFSPAENRAFWTTGLTDLARRIAEDRKAAVIPKAQVLVSVCLVHFRRPRLLMQALRSLMAQTYGSLEVILIDDGSNTPTATALLDSLEPLFTERGWQIIRTSNGYVGRARNIASQQARGEYLLFMDDDNVAMPGMVETLVSSAVASGADIVTSFSSVFEGQDEPGPDTPIVETYLPVGGALGFALTCNAISDTNALIRHSLFKDLGGFTEDYGVGDEDFELFLRAVLRGADILVVPEPLYWYRRQEKSINSTTLRTANRARSFRPFLDHCGPDMTELLVIAHSLAETGTAAAAIIPANHHPAP